MLRHWLTASCILFTLAACASPVTSSTTDDADAGTVQVNVSADGTVAGNPEDSDGTVAGNPTSETRQLTGTLSISPDITNAADAVVGGVEVVAVADDGSEVSTTTAVGSSYSLTLATDRLYELHVRQQGIEWASLRYIQGSSFFRVNAMIQEGQADIDLGNMIYAGYGEIFSVAFTDEPLAEDGDYNLSGHIDAYEGVESPADGVCAIRYASAFQRAVIPLNRDGSMHLYVSLNKVVASASPPQFSIVDALGRILIADDYFIVPQDTHFAAVHFMGMAVDTEYTLNIPAGAMTCDDGVATESASVAVFRTVGVP